MEKYYVMKAECQQEIMSILATNVFSFFAMPFVGCGFTLRSVLKALLAKTLGHLVSASASPEPVKLYGDAAEVAATVCKLLGRS